MIRAALVAFVLALSACSTPPSNGGEVAAADSCAARGGTMRPVGRAQTLQCVVRYSDAGQRCQDSSSCQGDCLATGEAFESSGKAVGQCAATSDRFGCRTVIKDGVAQPTLCID